jgi:hypothetical protein
LEIISSEPGQRFSTTAEAAGSPATEPAADADATARRPTRRRPRGARAITKE